MSYIQRHLQESVLQLSGEYPVILIAGPRGAGKTTMLRMLMDVQEMLPEGSLERESRIDGKAGRVQAKRNFVSLDNLRERELAKTDPELFLQLHEAPLFISEVQYAPELFEYIKKRVTSGAAPGSYWLTGSHLYEIMEGAYKALEGSVALLNLFPFSANELAGTDSEPYSIYKQIHYSNAAPQRDASSVFDFIWKGCSMAESFEDWDNFYADYVETCIRRDVRDMGGAIDPIKFMNFMTACAAHCGQLLNVKAIAGETGIDQVTAKNWLGMLSSLGLIFHLHPYEHEKLTRAIKGPKLYFYDPGLVCYLTKWTSAASAKTGAMAPQLFENFVVAEIIKGYSHHGAVPHICYLRDRDSAEINLIIEEGGVLYPAQIRLSGRPNRRMASAFALIRKDGISVGDGAIICLTDKVAKLGDALYALPAGEI